MTSQLWPDPAFDLRMMAATLGLGRRSAGQARPNPAVGSIIVARDADGVPRVVGRGVTAPGGRPHAEAVALAEAGLHARGATAYVTLEPCAHHGRAGPCTEALIAAGVARVVIAVEDPSPVAGGGIERLRDAGIAVTLGVARAEARRDHAGHFARVLSGRPHVRLKLAVSADGFVGRRGEGQVAISSDAARRFGHMLRATTDAILVGIGTALADDPLLTCRLPGLEARSPVRIVLDTHGRLPLDSALVRSAGQVPLWIMTNATADPLRLAALEAAGAEVLPVPLADSGRIDLPTAFVGLAERGVTAVLVEGGPRVAAELFDAELVDEALIIAAPHAIGEHGIPALPDRGIDDLLADPRFEIVARRTLGDDRLHHLWRRD